MLHLAVLTVGSPAAAAFQLRWKLAYNALAHAWQSLLYKCMQHVHLASVLLSVPSCGPSWILHPASSHYQPASAFLIWNGCSFEACDWLLGRLFCLWAVFPSIRGFLFFFFSEPPTLPSRLLFTCTWMQSARTQNNHSHCFHFGLFGSFLDLFSFPTHILHIQRRLTAPTVTVEGVTFPVEQLKRLLYSIILQILCAHADRLKWPGWARWYDFWKDRSEESYSCQNNVFLSRHSFSVLVAQSYIQTACTAGSPAKKYEHILHVCERLCVFLCLCVSQYLWLSVA